MSTATLNKVNNKKDKVQAYFTPPWAGRQICHALQNELGYSLADRSVYDPCAGQGHMLRGLKDHYMYTHGDDIYDYGSPEYNATGQNYIKARPVFEDDVVTNPPFWAFDAFVRTAVEGGARVTAMLVRCPVLCGGDRHDELYAPHPPSAVLVYTRRPHMQPGPPPATGGKSAMDSVVMVWERDRTPERPEVIWLPREKEVFEKAGDYFNTQPALYPDHVEA